MRYSPDGVEYSANPTLKRKVIDKQMVTSLFAIDPTNGHGAAVVVKESGDVIVATYSGPDVKKAEWIERCRDVAE